MRKNFGIFILIIGLIIVCLYTYSLIRQSSLDAENRAKAERLSGGNPLLQTVFNTSDKSGTEKARYTAIVIGGLLSVVGIIMIRGDKKKEKVLM